MRFKSNYGCLFVYLSGLLAFVQAQTATTSQSTQVLTDIAPKPTARFPASWYPPTTEEAYTQTVQRGLPYTAVLVTTTKAVDPKTGQEKTFSQRNRQLRDSEGRRRDEVEMPRPDSQGHTVMAHEVSVHDPVSHCDFCWMEPWVVPASVTGPPVATVTCMPLILRYTNQNIWRDGIVSKQQQKHDRFSDFILEPLGHRSMEGLDVVGTRTTTTRLDSSGAPTGTIVTEIWYSSELEELVSMRMTPGTDARTASAALPSYELTEVRREEPDPKLFYPPQGYGIRPTYPSSDDTRP